MSYFVRIAGLAAALAAIAIGLTAFDVAAGLLSGTPSQLLRFPALWWGLFASHVFAATLCAMVTGLVALIGRPSGHSAFGGDSMNHHTGWKRTLSRAVLVLALSAYPAASLAGSLTSGEWVQAQAFAPALQVGIAVAISLVAASSSWLVARLWRSPWARAGYLVGALALAIVNASVLPGLYLEAHLGLYVVSAFLTTWALLPEAGRVSGTERLRSLAPLFALGALSIGACLYLPWMGMRTRADVIAQSTGISSALSVAAPPIGSDHLARELESLDDIADQREPKPAFGTKPLGEQPRSVLLVVVDTLRADALPPVRTGPKPFAAPGDTPHLDAWIDTTYRFTNAYSQSSKTKASMPAMFRSLEAFEDPLTTGVSLSDFARELGLRPVAVVPQYFLMPAQTTSQALLEGFEVVDFFTKDNQATMLPKVEAMLDQVGGQPFLAWVHFYNMHQPYSAGGLPIEKGKSAAEKYRLALGWLDEQFGALMAALDERGLDDSTLVILAADHGEHLGEGNRVGHGDGVHDEEVHVPLAFRVPGTEGGEVEALAGNLDIVPTIANLFRRSADSSHRGWSLVPAMQEGSSRASRALYTISGDERVYGLVTQDHKLVYTPQVSTFSLYRRVEDPRDKTNLFGLDPLLDGRLVSRFVRYDPTLFEDELSQPKVLHKLAQELGTIDPDRGDAALELLLKAARGADDADVRQRAQALYDRAQSVEAKLMLSKYLGKRDAVWAKRWDDLLASVANTPEEGLVVRELAAMGAVSTRSSFAPKRLQQLVESKSPVLEDWLRLVSVWSKPTRRYGVILSKILEEPEQPGRERLLRLALHNVESLRRVRGGLRRELEARVLPLTESGDLLLAVAATEASKVSGGEASAERMAQILDSDADPRLKQAALYTLRRLRGREVMPYLLRASEDPLLLNDAIKLSAELRDPLAEPFLRDVAKNHYNAWTRRRAKQALKRLRGKEP